MPRLTSKRRRKPKPIPATEFRGDIPKGSIILVLGRLDRRRESPLETLVFERRGAR